MNMAAPLSTGAQSGEVVARTSGDEFMLLLTNPGHEQHADIQHVTNSALATLNAEIGRENDPQWSNAIAHWPPKRSQAVTIVMQLDDDAMVQQRRRRHTARAA